MTEYEYRSGPSIFMDGTSDWVIREVGKPGIVANVIGHETHAHQACRALQQADELDRRRADILKEHADTLAAALRIAMYDAHPTYGSTATWHDGIGGQTVTTGCAFTDPPPHHTKLPATLHGVLRDYIDRYGATGLTTHHTQLHKTITSEPRAEASKPPQEDK